MRIGRLIKKIFSLTVSALAVLIISGFLSLHPINEQPNVAPNLDSFVQAVNRPSPDVRRGEATKLMRPKGATFNTESSLVEAKNSPLKSFYRIIKMYLEDLF